MHARFLLFGQSRQTMAQVGNVLVGAGYTFAGHTDDLASLLRVIRSIEPDLLVMDPPESFHAVEPVLRIVEEEWLAAVILLVGFKSRELDGLLDRNLAVGWIPKPIQEETVLSISSQCVKGFRQMSAQQREITRLRKTLEERRVLERAKWVLGRQQDLTETEAYELIRARSRDTRQPMAKVAEAILLSSDIGKAKLKSRTSHQTMED